MARRHRRARPRGRVGVDRAHGPLAVLEVLREGRPLPRRVRGRPRGAGRRRSGWCRRWARCTPGTRRLLRDRPGRLRPSVVATIFVNPMQFGPDRGPGPLPAHARRRPRDVRGRAGVDVVWAPAVEDVYPHGDAAGDRARPGPARRRCSRARCGPATSPACSPWSRKFFNLVRPAVAFFGEKDYQQLPPDPADGRRPGLRRRRRRGADGARAGRARPVEPQRLPVARTSGTQALRAVAGAVRRAGRAPADGADCGARSGARPCSPPSPAWPSTTSSCAAPDLGAGARARRGPAARRRPGRHDPAHRQRRTVHAVRLPTPAGRRRRPAGRLETDVVVVGSGIAGLTTALHIARHSSLRVLLVTKDVLAAGSTRWAQGGIAAALGAGDSPERALRRTRSSPAPGSATTPRCACWSARGRPRCASSPRWAPASTGRTTASCR